MAHNGVAAAPATELPQQYNPNLDKIAGEIAAIEAQITTTVDEIGATSDRLASLRVHEQTLRDKLLKLESDRRAIISIDTKVLAKEIEAVVLADEDRMRKLQSEMDMLAVHKEQAVAELTAVRTVDGTIAGGPTPTNAHNQNVARYDLKAQAVATGLSADTLAQAPVAGVNAPADGKQWGIKHQRPASSILDIGQNVSASPYVNPGDYVVDAERPKPAEQSAKFSDWRSPSRTQTRVAQPPGGFSHMSSIFG